MKRTYSIENRISHWPLWRRILWKLFPYIPRESDMKDPE